VGIQVALGRAQNNPKEQGIGKPTGKSGGGPKNEQGDQVIRSLSKMERN